MASGRNSQWWQLVLNPTTRGRTVILVAGFLILAAVVAVAIKPELAKLAVQAFGHDKERDKATNHDSGAVTLKSGDGSSNQNASNISGGHVEQNSNPTSINQGNGYIISAPSNSGTVNVMPANAFVSPVDLILQTDSVLGKEGAMLTLPRRIMTNGFALQIIGSEVRSIDTTIVADLGAKLPKAASARTVADGRNGVVIKRVLIA